MEEEDEQEEEEEEGSRKQKGRRVMREGEVGKKINQKSNRE